MNAAQFDHLTILSLVVIAALALLALLRFSAAGYVPPITLPRLAGDGDYDYLLARAEEHEPALDRFAVRAAAPSGYGCLAELVPELSPTRDDIRIKVMVEEAMVGEIPDNEVRAFMQAMGNEPALCSALIVAARSANDAPAVRLDLVWPPRMG